MKKEIIILIVVIIALTGYLTLRSTDRAQYELPRLEKLEGAKIDRLVVKPIDDDPIELVKKDEKWYIAPQDYLADADKVQKMVSDASELTITALVSESKNYQRYELDDTNKMNVQAFIGSRKVREFDLGGVAPSFQHTFAKLADDPNIYHAKGAMKNTFDLTVENLRDKTVLAFDKDAAAGLTLEKGNHRLVLTQKELPVEKKENGEGDKDSSTPPKPKTQWQDADGQPVDQAAVNSLLDGMDGLKCEAYLEDSARDALKDPAWTVTADVAGTAHTLTAFPTPEGEENDRIPATSSDSKYGFEFSQYQLENIEKQVDKLLGIEAAEKE